MSIEPPAGVSAAALQLHSNVHEDKFTLEVIGCGTFAWSTAGSSEAADALLAVIGQVLNGRIVQPYAGSPVWEVQVEEGQAYSTVASPRRANSWTDRPAAYPPSPWPKEFIDRFPDWRA